jgi:hypothetical protein
MVIVLIFYCCSFQIFYFSTLLIGCTQSIHDHNSTDIDSLAFIESDLDVPVQNFLYFLPNFEQIPDPYVINFYEGDYVGKLPESWSKLSDLTYIKLVTWQYCFLYFLFFFAQFCFDFMINTQKKIPVLKFIF